MLFRTYLLASVISMTSINIFCMAPKKRPGSPHPRRDSASSASSEDRSQRLDGKPRRASLAPDLPTIREEPTTTKYTPQELPRTDSPVAIIIHEASDE